MASLLDYSMLEVNWEYSGRTTGESAKIKTGESFTHRQKKNAKMQRTKLSQKEKYFQNFKTSINIIV